MSSNPSAKYGVPCPKCHAGPPEPCRTITTGRVTDTHQARIDEYWAERDDKVARP